MLYGNGLGEFTDWEVLGDTEYHRDDKFEPPTNTNVVSSDYDYDQTLVDNFFMHVFLNVTGHAAIIDKFLGDVHAPYYETVQQDKTLFHDAEDKDPYWKIQQCYVLLIAAATEMENSIENLWKHGKIKNQRWYSDLRRFMAMNEMKAFCSAAPYCWSDEEHWYTPQHDTIWKVFLPCIYEFNDS